MLTARDRLRALAAVSRAPEPPPELDELTVRRAIRGEPAALTALAQRYQRPVFALLSRLCGDGRGGGPRALVEDLAQETFLRVFRALPAFEPRAEARLSSWILTIATRVGLNELRRQRPVTASLDDVEPAAMTTAAAAPVALEGQALGAALGHALAALPPGYRVVFLLREYHELSYEEIARALELDLGTVKSRLFRARAALRRALGGEE